MNRTNLETTNLKNGLIGRGLQSSSSSKSVPNLFLVTIKRYLDIMPMSFLIRHLSNWRPQIKHYDYFSICQRGCYFCFLRNKFPYQNLYCSLEKKLVSRTKQAFVLLKEELCACITDIHTQWQTSLVVNIFRANSNLGTQRPFFYVWAATKPTLDRVNSLKYPFMHTVTLKEHT